MASVQKLISRFFSSPEAESSKGIKPVREKFPSHDKTDIPVQPGVKLQLYWKNVPGLGIGPAVKLKVQNKSIVLYDCFGAGSGHFHVQFVVCHRLDDKHTDRVFMKEQTRHEQVDRAIFEIKTNSLTWMIRHPLPEVHGADIDLAKLSEAAAKAGEWMHDKIDNIPEIRAAEEADHALIAAGTVPSPEAVV